MKGDDPVTGDELLPEERAGGDDVPVEASIREVRQRLAGVSRRLGLIETVLVVAAGVAALLAGWLVALLVTEVTEWAFRPVWLTASLLLFGVPGAVVLVRERRDEAERRARLERALSTDDSRDEGSWRTTAD